MTGETEREAREQRLLVHFSKCGGGSETPKTERVIVSAKSSNDLRVRHRHSLEIVLLVLNPQKYFLNTENIVNWQVPVNSFVLP